MGNYQSKSHTHEEFSEAVNTETGEQLCFEGDPRSPSVDINRTPLQNQDVKTKPITKNVDLTKECFDKFEDISINPAIRALMNQIDPRSPTLDFQRTPLALMIKNPELILAHHELNTSHFLDESDIQTIDMLDNSSIGIKCALEPKNLCEELGNLSVQNENSCDFVTDSEQKSTSTNICLTSDGGEESKPVYGLLETNLDYLETDLDTVRRKRKVIIAKQNNLSTDKPNIETQVLVTQVDNIIQRDLSEEDPRSPTVGIDRTPILVTDKRSETKVVKSTKKANLQMKEVFKNNVKMQQKLSDEKVQEKDSIKKVTDSLLIYEDKFIDKDILSIHSKKNSNNVNGEGARTPLACMVNIDKTHTNSKQNTPSNDNLFDMHVKINKSSNIQSKIPIRVSKVTPTQHTKSSDIKTIKSRRIVQMDSENTPPQPRKACWDTDNSVVL